MHSESPTQSERRFKADKIKSILKWRKRYSHSYHEGAADTSFESHQNNPFIFGKAEPESKRESMEDEMSEASSHLIVTDSNPAFGDLSALEGQPGEQVDNDGQRQDTSGHLILTDAHPAFGNLSPLQQADTRDSGEVFLGLEHVSLLELEQNDLDDDIFDYNPLELLGGSGVIKPNVLGEEEVPPGSVVQDDFLQLKKDMDKAMEADKGSDSGFTIPRNDWQDDEFRPAGNVSFTHCWIQSSLQLI
ncbi:hypothetical protein BJ742DRAFT_87950 [Cladochytrium replicatum]|nr:hypothetical protein BJ742DRAFT_87950 [Cladochytrium replicatum]